MHKSTRSTVLHTNYKTFYDEEYCYGQRYDTELRQEIQAAKEERAGNEYEDEAAVDLRAVHNYLGA